MIRVWWELDTNTNSTALSLKPHHHVKVAVHGGEHLPCSPLHHTLPALDLFASEKDDPSINNNAILQIFFVLTDWRKVKYKKCKDDWDETIINDCNK
eukprot:5728552-Ditylum_brightwellii.AAC.1